MVVIMTAEDEARLRQLKEEILSNPSQKNIDETAYLQQKKLMAILSEKGAVRRAEQEGYLKEYLAAWALMAVVLGSMREWDQYTVLAEQTGDREFYLPGENAQKLDMAVEKAISTFMPASVPQKQKKVV